MGRPRFVFGAIGVGIVGVALLVVLSRSRSIEQTQQIFSPPLITNVIPDRPLDARNYNAARTKINVERIALWLRYQRVANLPEKEAILNEAREKFVRSSYQDIFPFWYGTKWDFYGTSETPAQGKIACGYFVSTVLRDLGMKVQRTRLAQQASERIISSLTSDDHTKRFRQVPIHSFVEAVKNWGPGLYVVGLDVHVGFILNVEGDVYFIHSAYIDPYCVVKERATESRILAASRYRVLGKLSEDDDLLLKWLRGDPFATRGR